MSAGATFLGPVSWPDRGAVTALKRANCALLQLIPAHGLTPYAQEVAPLQLADKPKQL